MTAHASSASAAGDGGTDAAAEVDTSSPEYLVMTSELATFKEMVNSKVVSYKQKKVSVCYFFDIKH